MKTLLFSFLTLLCTTSWATTTIVLVSPFQTQDTANNQLLEVIKLYADMPLGSELIVLDADTAKTIAALNVPDEPYFKDAKVRLQAAHKGLAALKRFTSNVVLANRTHGAMDIPRVLHVVARHHPDAQDIVLLGISALYDAPTQPGLNFTFGHVPSDGFFFDTATKTPFGTFGREKLLEGKRIHWSLSQDTPTDSAYLDSLTRFWHLYIHRLGGDLVSFTNDTDAALALYAANATPLDMPYKANPDAKRELTLSRTYVLDLSLFDTNETPANHSVIDFDKKYSVTLAIEWDTQGVDLDIYAQAADGLIVYFNSAPAGHVSHYKDVMSGGAQGQSSHFETIEYHEPIDLKNLSIVINAYRIPDNSEGVTGTLRINVGNRYYARSFSLEPDSANTGHDAKDVLARGRSSKHSLYFSAANVIQDLAEVAQ